MVESNGSRYKVIQSKKYNSRLKECIYILKTREEINKSKGKRSTWKINGPNDGSKAEKWNNELNVNVTLKKKCLPTKEETSLKE